MERAAAFCPPPFAVLIHGCTRVRSPKIGSRLRKEPEAEGARVGAEGIRYRARGLVRA